MRYLTHINNFVNIGQRKYTILEIMKKRYGFIFSLLVLSACFCFAENIATRDLPDCYVSGRTFNVVVSVITDPINFPSTGIVVTESLPVGWSVVSSDPPWSKYTASTNSYKWLAFSQLPIGSFTITYTVKVPDDTSGQYVFSGTLNDGYSIKDITGDTMISEIMPVLSPVFSPEPQSFYNFFPDIGITCSINGATIYYTIDGTDPDTGSYEYISPVHLTETTTIKARAFKDGFSPSQIVSGTYTIEIKKADINKDTYVDISDVILCLRAAVSLDVIISGQTYSAPYNDWIIAISDINNDTSIDISDVILILRKAVGLE